jgi:hypothetical protein
MMNLFKEKYKLEFWGVLMGLVAELGGIQDQRQWGEGEEMGGGVKTSTITFLMQRITQSHTCHQTLN